MPWDNPSLDEVNEEQARLFGGSQDAKSHQTLNTSSLGANADPCKMFVGGLAQHTTKDTLTAYYSQFGNCDSHVMLDGASGRSRGFGFVNFIDPVVTTSVLQMQHQVDGTYVTCTPYEGGPGKGGKGGKSRFSSDSAPRQEVAYLNTSMTTVASGPPAHSQEPVAMRDQLKVFVGGLSQHTTKESLDTYFSQFGHADSYVMTDRVTGRSRGFGFVNFRDDITLSMVLDQPQHEVDATPITCSAYAGKSSGPPPRRSGGDRGGGGFGSAPLHASSAQHSEPSFMSGNGVGSGDPKIFVGGLSQNTTKGSLDAYFSQYQHVVDAVGVSVSIYAEKGGSRGSAYGGMPPSSVSKDPFSGESAVSAVARVGTMGASILGSTQSEVLTNAINLITRLAQELNPSGGAEPLTTVSIGSLAPASEPPPPPPPLAQPSAFSPKLFVAGLTPNTTAGALQQTFSLYGPCDCEVSMDRSGASHGFGFVTFASTTSSAEALSMQHVIDNVSVQVSEYWETGVARSGNPDHGGVRASPY